MMCRYRIHIQQLGPWGPRPLWRLRRPFHSSPCCLPSGRAGTACLSGGRWAADRRQYSLVTGPVTG